MKPYIESAKYYDLIYLSKAQDMYRSSLRDIFHFSDELLKREPKSLIDFGCGTGNHAVELAKRGIQVFGIDLSNEQISIALQKQEEFPKLLEFIQGDMGNLPDIGKEYEVGASFFGSFCYLLEEKQIISFLNRSWNMIKKGGFLFLEIWNSLGVQDKSKHFFEFEDGDMKLLRFNHTLMDPKTAIAEMPMRYIIIKNSVVLADFTELHHLKTYTIPYFKSIVSLSKWKLHDIYSWKDPDRVEPQLNDLRYYVILKK